MWAVWLLLLAAVKGPDSTACLDCHDQSVVQTLQASPHKNLACVQCHSTIQEVPHDTPLPKVSCGKCHADESKEAAQSVHDGKTACAGCHGTGHSIHQATEAPPEITCASCHKDQVAQYLKSAHGRAQAGGVKEAPRCSTCHGPPHGIAPAGARDSKTYKTHIAETCATCHANPQLTKKFRMPVQNPFELYMKSVHGVALASGNLKAPTCTDCHGVHDIEPLTEPTSKIFKNHVPETCGACHTEIATQYQDSIHWTGYQHGSKDAPVCNDCHSEHAILPRDNPASPIYALNIPKTCADCHESERIISRYDLPTERLESYNESFHGLATEGGKTTVANCASCHGAHRILPADDPRSSINPNHLAETCGQCHTGISEAVAIGSIHGGPGPGSGIVAIVTQIYIWLIVIVIGGMLGHNFLAIRRRQLPGAERINIHTTPDIESEGNYQRFPPVARALHALLFISFIGLVYTGFALKNPTAAWALPLLKPDGGMDLRGVLHRVFGVVMLAVMAANFLMFVFTRKGREEFKALGIGINDLKGVLGNFAFFLRLKPHPPEFERFSYIEKAEYWALIWGTVIMGLTGVLMWAENFSLRQFAKWWMDLFTAVHFYEAILATLAILVWHFYWVIFDPSVYPYSTAMFSGFMPLKWLKHEHRKEYDKMAREREAEAQRPAGGKATPDKKHRDGRRRTEGTEKKEGRV